MCRGQLVAAILLLLAVPAAAQAPEPAPAGTPDGAKSVAEGLAPYLGASAVADGVLKVEPDPAGYRVTFDPGPLLKALAHEAFTLEMTPYSFVVSRRDDGNWNYFSDAAIDVTMRISESGRAQVFDYRFGPQLSKGVYSPALATFLSAVGSIESMTMKGRQDDGDVSSRFGRMVLEQSAKPANGGAADISTKQTIDGFEETITVKETADTPPGGLVVTLKSSSIDVDATVAAMTTRPMVDLYAFLVARPQFLTAKPGEKGLAAHQDEFKSKIRDVLPLWTKLDSSYGFSDFAVGTQFGGVTAKTMTFGLVADGISRAAAISYSFGFAGLDMSSPAIPAWTASLIPREADLRFRLDNLDLQSPADIVLADLDFTRAEPLSEAAQSRIGELFATNPPRFVIEPSRLKSRDLDVTLAGSVVASAGRPAVTMDISAAGIDKAITTLQDAARDNPDLNQAVGGLSIAKGFGKTLPDGRTQWIIDAASDGSVKVNGFEIKSAEPGTVPDIGDDGDDAAPDGVVPPDQAPTDDNALPDAPPAP